MQEAGLIPEEVLENELSARELLFDKKIFTIDGVDTKDLDDAISLEKMDNGNYLLSVHIADVSHYVQPDSLLDQEAFHRGTSVYLIDQVIPMLPKRLSNGICSLNEGVIRLTMSCFMEINGQGQVVSRRFSNSAIRSCHQLNYDEINRLLEEKDQIISKKYEDIADIPVSYTHLPESGHLAGLGHAITDFDTGEILTVKDGTIVESQIIDVVKGEAGTPGELKGSFTDNAKALGSIERNTEYGIYGNAETELHNALYTYLEAADRSEVELGKATLLCTVDGNGVKEYSCQIIKVYDQGTQSQRSFIIEIDDAALLEKTGGIVQGMSGSPIIQNGKLIGAVTHVFIDNPKRGYGVYVDWMLQDMNEME